MAQARAAFEREAPEAGPQHGPLDQPAHTWQGGQQRNDERTDAEACVRRVGSGAKPGQRPATDGVRHEDPGQEQRQDVRGQQRDREGNPEDGDREPALISGVTTSPSKPLAKLRPGLCLIVSATCSGHCADSAKVANPSNMSAKNAKHQRVTQAFSERLQTHDSCW